MRERKKHKNRTMRNKLRTKGKHKKLKTTGDFNLTFSTMWMISNIINVRYTLKYSWQEILRFLLQYLYILLYRHICVRIKNKDIKKCCIFLLLLNLTLRKKNAFLKDYGNYIIKLNIFFSLNVLPLKKKILT